MYQKKIPEDLDCGIILTGKVLSGKWKPCIIDGISRGINRPGELQRAIPEAPARVIKMQLRELEHFGIVYKNVYSGFPLKVEYFLTEAGNNLLPLITLMERWGINNKDMVVSAEKSLKKTGIAAISASSKKCLVATA